MKTSRNTRNQTEKPKKLKNRNIIPRFVQEKLAITVLVIMLALFLLGVRLYSIIDSKNDEYTKIVLSQRSTYDSRTIPYRRGDIVDRNGTKVATSERVYNVILDVVVVTDEGESDKYIDSTLDVLEECFGIDSEEVRDTIKANPDSRYEVLKKGVSYEDAKKFQEIDEDDKKYPNVQGVWLEDDYQRTYPYNSLASDVIGFSVSGNQGAIGIESAYNDILNGTDGREYGYFDSASSVERTVKAAKNGNTVVSTIDVTLQSIVEKYILEFNEAHKGEEREDELGSKNTAVIIMDPNSGEILAEASYPNFDLNNPRDLTPWYTTEALAKMSDDDKLNAMNNLWRNFCVSDAFEPGSTAKPFTLATGLETGALTGQETYVCQGGTWKGDWYIQCHNTSGHGTENVDQAIANSCNVALMAMADKIGVEDFIRYQHIFGFGEYTGIDLPGEASTENLIFTAENMGETDLATSSFGQSFNVTMTQMVSAFSSLINGGYYYQPHVVKQIQDENGNVIETNDPTLLRKTVSKQTSDRVKEALRAVMTDGTGVPANVEGYDIGGKTGTAEKLPRSAHNYLVSFCGFAPADDPQLLMYVVIDTPNLPGKEQAHSTFATEVFQKIMAEALPYLNVFPDTDTTTEDASLADQNEGITNNNEGGLEPGTGETAAETEAPTDAEGNVIQTEPAPEEEVIPYDDGLGLPDDMPSDGSGSAAESAGEAQSMESVQETETMKNGAEETTQTAQ